MYYDEHIRRQAVRLVVRDGLTRAEVSRRFGIRGKSTISKWIDTMDREPTDKGSSASSKKSQGEYIKRIAELESQLRRKSMEADFYRIMVDEAEKMFGIEIKKKPDTAPPEGSPRKQAGR